MSKLVHIWIDDNLDRGLLDNNYTEMVNYCKGNGDLVRMDCLYQGGMRLQCISIPQNMLIEVAVPC